MKLINKIVLVVGLLFSTAAYSERLELAVLEVKDADTIAISVLLPTPLNELSVRVLSIDAPEIPAKSYPETGKLNRAECVAEAELGLEATAYVEQLIEDNGGKITIDNFDWGKYGGRILADVYIGDINLAQRLIEQGYAISYDGGARTHSWCN